MTMCPRCEAFYVKYPLECDEDDAPMHVLERNSRGVPCVTVSPIQCAFLGGVFTPDNWGCETMKVVRDVCDFHPLDDPSGTHGFSTFFARHDLRQASLGVITIPESDADIQQGYLVMSWYKSRGTMGRAMVFWDYCEPEPLRLVTAELILGAYPNG